jgi:protein SCO1
MLKLFKLMVTMVVSLLITNQAAPAATAAVPPDSIYQMQAKFQDQDGRYFSLAQRRHRVQLVAMFYTSCKYICPLIVDSAKATLHGLDDRERQNIDVLLVSFDTNRDTSAVLKSVAVERKLQAPQWTLARTEKPNVRKLAALLGIRYRELKDGEFNHSSALVLLDEDGRILARTEKMGVPADAEFLAKLKSALRPPTDQHTH